MVRHADGRGGSCNDHPLVSFEGLLQDGDAFRHESLIGSLFIGRIEGRTKAGAFDAVVPSIEGSAHITGLNTLFVEEGAPFPVGFQL